MHAQQKQTRNEQSPRPRKLVCLRCTRIVREHSQIFKPRLRHASVKPVLWPLIRLTRIDGSTFFFPLKFLDISRRSEVFGTLARQADSRRCFLQELGNKLLRASRYPLSRLPRAGHANWTRLRLAYLRLFCTRAISALSDLRSLLLLFVQFNFEMRPSNGDAGNSSKAHGASPKAEDADRRSIASEVQVRLLFGRRSAI